MAPTTPVLREDGKDEDGSPGARPWRETKAQILRDEFRAFCAAQDLPCSPHSAHLFALRCEKAGGNPFAGFSEREIILAVAGELPPYYD